MATTQPLGKGSSNQHASVQWRCKRCNNGVQVVGIWSRLRENPLLECPVCHSLYSHQAAPAYSFKSDEDDVSAWGPTPVKIPDGCIPPRVKPVTSPPKPSKEFVELSLKTGIAMNGHPCTCDMQHVLDFGHLSSCPYYGRSQ